MNWLVKVNQPIETGVGIIQRAAAFEKLIHYSGSMDSKIPSNFKAKNFIHRWLAAPTENETKYALEYMNYTVDIYDSLQGEKKICGPLSHEHDDGFDNDEIAIARSISKYFKSLVSDASQSSAQLVSRLFTNLYKC